MALISGIYAKKHVVPAAAGLEVQDLDPETAHNKGIAVNYFGNILEDKQGKMIYWKHPQKYFCESGYLRYKSNGDKIITDDGYPVSEDILFSTVDVHYFKAFIHEVLYPTSQDQRAK